MRRKHPVFFISLLGLTASSQGFADGLAVDRVYEPYVNPLEKELEYRRVEVNRSESGRQRDSIQKLGFAAAVSDRLALEAYIIDDDLGEKTIDAFELEARYQLTEQGEYSADWGLMLEYEKQRENKETELAATVIIAKQIKRFTTTVNASLIYENLGNDKVEWDSQLNAQLRYMYHPHLEPAIEFYAGEDYRGIGPAAMGTIRFSNANSLHWQLGSIFGLDQDSEDVVIRFLLEYEFY
ncbi:hypothetical protein IB286_04940 [Spongiibacter sp. KMU-158]|uniref:Transporter n=1 Tax=Spongiibacter pelagi TaxID=2760804 RepID=A0A927GVR0_9GAMM|nr:hypothetical protein [Spongiibacter pelagi]MBD2858348.1 hypothetical protein [Spongiibacter pelagi]